LLWIVSHTGSTERQLDVYDISLPAEPRHLGSTPLTPTVAPQIQGPSEVVARGDVAWVADANHLRVLEVAADDRLIEHDPVAAQTDADYLALDGDTLFVFGRPSEVWSSILVLDVSDALAPRVLDEVGEDEFPFRGGETIAASTGRLYVSAGSSGIVILDSRAGTGLPSPTPSTPPPSGTPRPTWTPTATSPSSPTTTPVPESVLYLPWASADGAG
jgi:hypothetical protein